MRTSPRVEAQIEGLQADLAIGTYERTSFTRHQDVDALHPFKGRGFGGEVGLVKLFNCFCYEGLAFQTRTFSRQNNSRSGRCSSFYYHIQV